MKVVVTMEKTIRVSKSFDSTDSQIQQITENGANPFFHEMLKELTKQEESYLHADYCDLDVEYDYSIEDEYGKVLVGWD